MSSPIEIVSAFCATFPEDGGRTSIRRWFTPETIWVNEGVSATKGIEQAIVWLQRPGRSPIIEALYFDMLAIEDGHIVAWRDYFDVNFAQKIS